MAEPPPYPGTPRWVFLAGAVAILLIVLFVVAHLAGFAPMSHG